MKAITIAVLAVAVSLAVGLPLTLVSGAVWSPYHVGRLQAPSYQSEQGYGGMIGGGPGNGGMMGSSGSNYNVMNTPTSTIDNSTFNTLNSLQGGVIVNRTSNTVFVGTSGVTVPVEASPLWYPQPGDYWLVYGLVNPTIVIKQGEQVNFLFINMDNETHVAAITTIAPPYSYMPMMNGMMGGGTQTATWLAIGPMLSGVTSNLNVAYSEATLTVTFSNTGTFWYLCLYPGHAQMGMYGRIVVSSQ